MGGVGSIATIDSWGIDAIDALITPSQLKELGYAGVAGGVGVLVVNKALDMIPVDFVKAGYGRIGAKAALGVAGAMALKHFMPSEPAAAHGLAGAVIGDAALSLFNMLTAPAATHGFGRVSDVQTFGPTGFAGYGLGGGAPGVQVDTPTGYEETLSAYLY